MLYAVLTPALQAVCRWHAQLAYASLTTAPPPLQPLPQVESYFYDIRKQLFDYDQVLNTQVRDGTCL